MGIPCYVFLCMYKQNNRSLKIERGGGCMDRNNKYIYEQYEEKSDKSKDRRSQEQDSLQYNSQDLDQDQKVDVNPMQLNTQNLHIHIDDYKNSFSGKIMGTTYLQKNAKKMSNVSILLFFGLPCEIPVYRTDSDENGNYIIEDLPPGYYTLLADISGELKYESRYIKVLPGETVHHQIFLQYQSR